MNVTPLVCRDFLDLLRGETDMISSDGGSSPCGINLQRTTSFGFPAARRKSNSSCYQQPAYISATDHGVGAASETVSAYKNHTVSAKRRSASVRTPGHQSLGEATGDGVRVGGRDVEVPLITVNCVEDDMWYDTQCSSDREKVRTSY